MHEESSKIQPIGMNDRANFFDPILKPTKEKQNQYIENLHIEYFYVTKFP
jgi:hypothetical protein